MLRTSTSNASVPISLFTKQGYQTGESGFYRARRIPTYMTTLLVTTAKAGNYPRTLTWQATIRRRKNEILERRSMVLQRQTLADGLAHYLSRLGLQRRVKTPSLHDILNQQGDNHEATKAGNRTDEHEIVRQ
jgi:hypothetical protein